ncbi:MAG: hypothetical protein IT388_01600 [Nitrospirales bacterium]|nr:hypothetical protein [Nitrospirales bacterium]
MKALLRHINLLNFLLLAAALFITCYLLVPLFSASVAVKPLPVRKIVSEQREATAAEAQRQAPSVMEYAVIGEQNVFHPERKIPVEKNEEKLLPKPEFSLYGTLITGAVSLAYMEDRKSPRSTPGRGKRQTALKVGDSLSGYTVKEIAPERVVMMRGEDRVEVKVISPDNKKDRTEPGTAASPPVPSQAGRMEEAPASARPASAARIERPARTVPQPQTPGGSRTSTPGSVGFRFAQ